MKLEIPRKLTDLYVRYSTDRNIAVLLFVIFGIIVLAFPQPTITVYFIGFCILFSASLLWYKVE